MPDIIEATQTAHGYLTSPLSANINETDEGFLVIVGCPIARTGWQEYTVRDLPQQAAADLGVDVANPSATIDLYRPAKEVFAPEFLASLNGKPIVDNHPPDFVNTENFAQYAKGHIQNPRKGTEQLEDGEWPLIADLVISAEPLVSKVRDGTQRDVSLGYDYSIRRNGQRIEQCDMAGNHAAVVPKGRAGDFVSIKDAAPEQISEPPTPPAAVERAATESTSTAVLTEKEKKPVSNLFKHLLGLGLKQYATTETDPEKLAEAAEALNQKPFSNRARAADADEEEEEKPVADKGKGKDKKGKDAKAKDDLGDPEDKDVEPADDRKRLHDAFDAMLDRKGKDADIAELRQLMDEFLGEEEEEPEHAAVDIEPADTSELEQVVGAETDDAEVPCPECGEMGDACQCADDEAEPGEALVVSGEEELEDVHARDARAKDSGKAKDRARAADASAGAKAVLKLIRPYVARSNDAGLRSTFNAALGSVTRSSRASNGSVAKFAGAARARDKAPSNPNPDRARVGDSESDRNTKLQKAYDDARLGVTAAKGGK